MQYIVFEHGHTGLQFNHHPPLTLTRAHSPEMLVWLLQSKELAKQLQIKILFLSIYVRCENFAECQCEFTFMHYSGSLSELSKHSYC